MEKIISIVVPVYKVEKDLERCITSLINQTYPGIEIILVDDGSPDKCPEICERYAQMDSRIKVIHKENGGLSDARNHGLLAASGEYVLFVDSDDFLELDACEHFIEILNGRVVDMVVGNAIKVENGKKTAMCHTFDSNRQIVTGKEYLKEELTAETMYIPVWMNLYNREFLMNEQLTFKVGLLHEDVDFTPRAFLKAKKVIGSKILFYNYIIRDGSITKGKDLSRNGVHVVQTCYELARLYDELEDQQLRLLLNNQIVTDYLYAFQMGALYKSEYKNLINKQFLMKRAYSKKNKMKVYLFYCNKWLYYHLNRLSKI